MGLQAPLVIPDVPFPAVCPEPSQHYCEVRPIIGQPLALVHPLPDRPLGQALARWECALQSWGLNKVP